MSDKTPRPSEHEKYPIEERMSLLGSVYPDHPTIGKNGEIIYHPTDEECSWCYHNLPIKRKLKKPRQGASSRYVRQV